jgi:preprotein translocase subunit SecG
MKKLTSLVLAVVFAISVALAVINTSNATVSQEENTYASVLIFALPPCPKCD